MYLLYFRGSTRFSWLGDAWVLLLRWLPDVGDQIGHNHRPRTR